MVSALTVDNGNQSMGDSTCKILILGHCIGCSLPNSMLSGRRSKVEVHPTFDTAFHKIEKAIGDIYDSTCCHKLLFYVANKFL